MLNVGSLFSGIGGFDLGLERTGGMRVVFQAESDAWCRGILAQHWPGVPCFDDVAGHLVADTLRANGKTGGRYDKQPLTVAHTLRAEGFDASEDGTGRGTPLVANTLKQSDGRGRGWGTGPEGNFVSTPANSDGVRATPILSGRVDDPRPDGPRYAAMGNAVTVNVITWIGRRILEYEEGRLAA